MIEQLLKDKKQEQLIDYMDLLSNDDKNILENNIKSIDIDFINKLYINSYTNDVIDMTKISPLDIEEKNNTNSSYGIEAVKNNEYGIVLLAGGNASRLGMDLPKGCLKLNINNKEISIFELYINQLKDAYNKYNVYINLYVMTNSDNHDVIKNFFNDNNYFDYPKDKIHFFIQGNLPIVDVKGKLMLKDKTTLLLGPNGNGDVFNALKQSGLLDDMISNKLKYILFLTIDNIFNIFVDVNMLGSMIKGGYPVATKTLTKTDSQNKEWIFAKLDGKPSMIPTSYITEELTNTKINNKYVYREKNITYHIVEVNELVKYATSYMPYHRNYKKYNYIDMTGNKVVAESNNSFKFEKFLFDAFTYSDDMLLYRVGLEEFHPIKTEEDIQIAENYFNNKKES